MEWVSFCFAWWLSLVLYYKYEGAFARVMETYCDRALTYSLLSIFPAWCALALVYAFVTIIRKYQLAKYATELELRRRYDVERGSRTSTRRRESTSAPPSSNRSGVPQRAVRFS
ncbi:hypothetical protein [Yerba mate-associated circular DNA virus 1]|uniref:Uncharacterized protein n=1 Tax=Yerba mate-associated circular DNA virus 1 TaxID=2219873 RepID=A0A2Z4ELI3_9VIRU|nr:hypothetical protein [Yerba mate-associated circular DNA virus 1]AWV57074.1 hypothetical protein [Yerba mate-associated circular DNA virus 1]AWV57079.1 hypothetical protein [Yerba mate-associated circular DNA virus 1]AWV57084.1 hypothetical protein [Yerba mate-associated circular DNA virus 1]